MLTAERERYSWRFETQIFLFSMLMVLGLYGGVLQSWWCCDDPQILKHALRYSPVEYFSVPDAWRTLIPYSLTPWLTFSYDIDHALFGLKPTGYYAHNLLVIAFCACLIYTIVRQWVDRWHAVGGVVLFLVGSPIMAASQQLMVRHYVEGLFFYLISMWLVIRRLRDGADRAGWLAGVAFAIAATAKEIYLPLGFVLFLLPMGSFRQRLKVACPILLVMLLYVPWRWYMLGDVVGGYTPVGDLGRGDLAAALGQFAKIPGLLLVLPWIGLSGVVMAMGLLLARSGKNAWAILLLALLPVLLLAPLIPLARQPGIGSGSDRYFIALWAAAAIGVPIVLGLAAAGRAAWMHLFTMAVLLVLAGSAWGHARQVRRTLLPWLHEQQVQGRTLVMAESRDVVYLTPAVAAWYVSGLMDLRKEFGRPDPPPVLAVDELDLSSVSLINHRVVHYDSARQAMVESTSQVPRLLDAWRTKVRVVPLSVNMEFDVGAKTMHWQLGPYEKGGYTILQGGGRQPLPRLGALRMDKPLDGSFRFRYDAPEGWIAYTPPLRFVAADRDRHYRVSWHGTAELPTDTEGR